MEQETLPGIALQILSQTHSYYTFNFILIGLRTECYNTLFFKMKIIYPCISEISHSEHVCLSIVIIHVQQV